MSSVHHAIIFEACAYHRGGLPRIAIRSGLPLVSGNEKPFTGVLRRSEVDGRLEVSFGNKELPFSIDFLSPTSQRRAKQCFQELVVKAAGTSHLKAGAVVWDSTAGLGRDAFLMAAAGARVRMFERNPVMHCLLGDALSRLSSSSSFAICGEIVLYPQELLKEGLDRPDIVYVDPMYKPNSVGRRSAVKKDTQCLQRIVGDQDRLDEENERLLMESALYHATMKVVVKRALAAPPLCGMKPSATLKGSTQRFDSYAVQI